MIHLDEFEVDMDLEQGMSRSPDFPVDEKTLKSRFDSAPWSLIYMQHQRDGSFWHEPVHPLDDIQVPVFMIGGMLDGYRDSIPRMLERMKVPMKAIIGPWNHTFPDHAVPGPSIEWRREAVRWWDYWLRGRDTGIMQEPQTAVYMQHWHPPDLKLQTISGDWRNESSWPPPQAKPRTLYLSSAHALQDSASESSVHQLNYVPSSGVETGFWWGDLTVDQRPADAYSLVYDSSPLEEDMAILGRPDAQLRVSVPVPLADWIARLSDVAPDGTVTLIAGAGINGAQRDSATDPQDLEPGRVYSMDVQTSSHFVGLSQRASHSPCDFEFVVANHLVNALQDDYVSVSRGDRGIATDSAGRSRAIRLSSQFPAARAFRSSDQCAFTGIRGPANTQLLATKFGWRLG
jgi:uncharacterized protein